MRTAKKEYTCEITGISFIKCATGEGSGNAKEKPAKPTMDDVDAAREEADKATGPLHLCSACGGPRHYPQVVNGCRGYATR